VNALRMMIQNPHSQGTYTGGSMLSLLACLGLAVHLCLHLGLGVAAVL
jgi:hypothetical protein